MRAGTRIGRDKMPASATERAGGKFRGAPFGIMVAVILASLLWAGLIGLCVYMMT